MKKKKIAVVLAAAAALAVIVVAMLGLSSGGDASWREKYDLGVRYLENGRYDEAIISFSASLLIEKRPETYTMRAQALMESGRVEQAAGDYRQAAKLDGSNPQAWLGLANALLAQGDSEAAKEALRSGLDETGGDRELDQMLQRVESGVGIAPNFTPDESLPRIRVSNIVELEEALENNKSDVVIVLQEGDYYPDWSLQLYELTNVTLEAEGDVRILTNSGEDLVLSIYECRDVTIDGITMGHDPAVVFGGCSAGVVDIYCSGTDDGPAAVNFVDCDIFGCGVLGIYAGGDVHLTAVNTTIRDCSSGALDLNCESDFYNCTFSGNGYQFSDDTMIWASNEPVRFYNCMFEKNLNREFTNEDSTCELYDGCGFSDNGWGDNTASRWEVSGG